MKNCSYHLLALLDAARPALKLVEEFSGWVIPLDTVKSILARKGLAGESRYRPASGTLLSARAKEFNASEIKTIKRAVAKKDIASVVLEDKDLYSKQLDAADEYASYLALKGKVSEEEIRDFQYKLLLERSKLSVDLSVSSKRRA